MDLYRPVAACTRAAEELVVAAGPLRGLPLNRRARPPEFASGGPIAGVHVSPPYRVSVYLAETPRFHLRVTFDRPVAGLSAVGRARHVRFGLLWSEANERR